MPEHLECEVLQKERYINPLTYTACSYSPRCNYMVVLHLHAIQTTWPRGKAQSAQYKVPQHSYLLSGDDRPPTVKNIFKDTKNLQI